MLDQYLYAMEHGNDLRREAAAYRRVPSRAARRRPTVISRFAGRVRAAVLHRPVAPIGCQA